MNKPQYKNQYKNHIKFIVDFICFSVKIFKILIENKIKNILY